MSRLRYRGRFAPSPTGPLHLGSLAAALASWLDARAHQGVWLVRIEDIDPPREEPGAAQSQLYTLARLGMIADEAPVYQSACVHHYEQALSRLQREGQVYPCACSRTVAELAARSQGLAPQVYPGTCRDGPVGNGPMSSRVRVPAQVVQFDDRACGSFSQHLQREVGDFVVRRADGLWSYQLAVVVDDARQGVTDVVRGADLLDNTPRQIHLQGLLGLATPRYLHVPVIKASGGAKLSKQTGAAPLDVDAPLRELDAAWRHLGFAPTGLTRVAEFLQRAVSLWRERWSLPAAPADTIVAPAINRAERETDPGAPTGPPA